MNNAILSRCDRSMPLGGPLNLLNYSETRTLNP